MGSWVFFSILGPLEITHGDMPVPFDGARQRAVLGILLLNANRVVTTASLAGALWRGDPPPTAGKMVRKAVAEVRTMLSTLSTQPRCGPAVVTAPQGYLLRVAPEQMDLPRFLDQARQARSALATDPSGRAVRQLRQTLALSRGPVLADLVDLGVSSPELRALEQRRLAVLESLFDAALCCGRHRDIAGDLEALLEKDRTTERLIGQCMLAFYRSGRQLDALNVYRRTRAAFVRSHCREPGRELRELHLAILNQASALDWVRRPLAVAVGMSA